MARKMEKLGQHLAEQGYCRISKIKKIVSRIDKENWIEVLAGHYGKTFNEMLREILANPGVYEDLYRREFSRDRLYVGLITSRAVPGSSSCQVAYLEKVDDVPPPGTEPAPFENTPSAV